MSHLVVALLTVPFFFLNVTISFTCSLEVILVSISDQNEHKVETYNYVYTVKFTCQLEQYPNIRNLVHSCKNYLT